MILPLQLCADLHTACSSTICPDTLQRTSDRARRRGFTFTTAQRLLQHRNDPYGKHPVCLTVGDQTAIAAHYCSTYSLYCSVHVQHVPTKKYFVIERTRSQCSPSEDQTASQGLKTPQRGDSCSTCDSLSVFVLRSSVAIQDTPHARVS